jgi:hypothetical protein
MILNIVNPPSLFMLQLLLPCHYSHKSPPPPPPPLGPFRNPVYINNYNVKKISETNR